jgi:antitoxin component of MazEF toxin-antitoxin module
MSRVTVGKWGKNLAIRVPFEVAETAGLSEGEEVDIEAKDGDLVIRRPVAHARADARKAAAEIRKHARGRSLGGVSIKELIDDGRRG